MKATISPRELTLLLAEGEEPWQKNRKMIKAGYPDLEYLPRSRAGWNATLAAHAFSARLHLAGEADLNEWAAMHACAPSARYADLGDDALVLWHGTSDERAQRIREAGLFHKRGLWTTTEPRVAHGYTRGRSKQFGAGSATVVIVFDRREIQEGVHYSHDSPVIYRFHSGLDRRHVEYICWGDRVEFCGEERAAEPCPWGQARFKRRGGEWVPLSRPPVRLDDEIYYDSLEKWLQLSAERVLRSLGTAAAVEVFSSLYATIDPWRALEHEAIFDLLEQSYRSPRFRRGADFALPSG